MNARIMDIMKALGGKKPMMKKKKMAGMGHEEEASKEKMNDEGMTHSPEEGMTTLEAGEMGAADEMDASEDGMNHDEMMMESPEEEESPMETAMEEDENEHMGGEDARNMMEMEKADMEPEMKKPQHLFGKKPGGMHILIALANAKRKGMGR